MRRRTSVNDLARQLPLYMHLLSQRPTMNAPQASTVSTEGLAASGVAPVVIAQATSMPLGAPAAASSMAPAASAAPAGIGTLSNATPGVAVMREGVRIPVDGNQTLMAGDRVIVP